VNASVDAMREICELKAVYACVEKRSMSGMAKIAHSKC
jgi:hypothetical protein